MSPSEEHTPPASGRTHYPDAHGCVVSLAWLCAACVTLVVVSVLVPLMPPSSTAPSWSWPTAEFLLFLLGVGVSAAIPGALVVLGHPWAAAMRRVLEQHFTHPRLVGLAQVWAALCVQGWLSVMVLLQLRDALVPLACAVLLVALGPLVAIPLLDRRR